MIDLVQTRLSLFYLAAYLFPLSAGLLLSPTTTFHLLGSKAEHAGTLWRWFGVLLLVLAIVVVNLIWNHRAASTIITVIVRVVFVGLFSYLVGHAGNRGYVVVLIVLGLGEIWTLIALAIDLRAVMAARQG
jgi:hypothetical protein